MLGHVRIGSRYAPTESQKYQGAYYHETFCKALKIPTFAEKWGRDYEVGLLRLAAIAQRVAPGNAVSLLDVGCGNGAFVTAALDAGYNAFGVDPGEASIEWAKARDRRLEGRLSARSTIPSAKTGWRVVTCHDVLEHLVDPFAHLIAIARAMAAPGLLVIEQPDPTSSEAVEQGRHWRHIKPYEHTYIPSRETWKAMLACAGLIVRSTLSPVPSKVAIYAERPGGPGGSAPS